MTQVDKQMTPNGRAFSVEQFCESHGNISRSFFYKLLAAGQGPRLMKVGRRVLISEEAAADWRASMEA
jgi:predicted DNA-binding transcriptional regulator AlpA